MADASLANVVFIFLEKEDHPPASASEWCIMHAAPQMLFSWCQMLLNMSMNSNFVCVCVNGWFGSAFSVFFSLLQFVDPLTDTDVIALRMITNRHWFFSFLMGGIGSKSTMDDAYICCDNLLQDLDLKVVKDTHFMGLFLFLMYQDPILDAWNIYELVLANSWLEKQCHESLYSERHFMCLSSLYWERHFLCTCVTSWCCSSQQGGFTVHWNTISQWKKNPLYTADCSAQ